MGLLTRVLRPLWLAGCLLLCVGAWAQATEAPAKAPVAGAEASAPAPLKVENRTLFTFRASFGAFTPAQRAEAARERIRSVVDAGGPLAVSVESREGTTIVLLDGEAVFGILPGDINPLLQQTMAELTQATKRQLEEAAAAYKERVSPAAMLRSTVFAAAATALYALLVWGIVRARRALLRRFEVMSAEAVSHIKGQISRVISPQALGGFGAAILLIAAWAVGLFVTYAWLTFVLARFPYTRPWGLQLEQFLIDTATKVALAILGAVPDLFIVVIIVLLTRAASHLVTAIFERVESGHVTLGFIDPFTAPTTRRLVNAALWVFALAMAYPYLPGSDTEAFKGVSVLVGLMVSLGASSVVGQAASGLILTYSQAFKLGEYVRIGDTEGTLLHVGMFSTRVETGLGELVVLPNSYVLSTTTKNYSRAFPGAGFVLDTTVTIGYATPWRQVHAMLKEAAARTPGIATHPPPAVAQIELSDFYPAYRLICYAETQQPRKRAVLLSELHAAIQDVFNENGVQIMSPHYMSDPPQPQVVPKEQWYAPPATRPDGGGGPA